MKRKERHLTVMGWVVVGLLDTLAGVISGELMALWQLPSTYRWRGYQHRKRRKRHDFGRVCSDRLRRSI